MAKILKDNSEEFQRKALLGRGIKVCGGHNTGVVLVTMIMLCEMKNDSLSERY
jgi:hypothetical protein